MLLCKEHLAVSLLLATLCLTVQGRERAGIIVSAKGEGDFRTIQEALNSIPSSHREGIVILIRNGIYNEKLFIQKSFVTLVGEDRDSTKIVYAELRTNWTKTRNGRPDGTGEELDWGSAVINIGKGARNITLANLTVHNNYGTLYGNHDHQFAVRGFDATRIMLLSCNVISDGGDALALWNRESGMYYHNDCYFEGWVDYVCPRGWCYIADSKFFGHNMSASIWHDGSANKKQKFVIRNSSFDGVQGFPLGRHHRDAQMYLISCTFSKTMADSPIYVPKSPNTVPWIWGVRHYFYDCMRDGGNFSWFADNLNSAEASPKADQITARWTFDGKWDPEANMPSVLPFAFLPNPRTNAKNISVSDVRLSWVPGRNADSHNVYFGTENPPPFVRSQQEASFSTGTLRQHTQYFWRVDEVAKGGIVQGRVWNFTTE